MGMHGLLSYTDSSLFARSEQNFGDELRPRFFGGIVESVISKTSISLTVNDHEPVENISLSNPVSLPKKEV
jgi:hypothetical protein